jgi:hypothetical protein
MGKRRQTRLILVMLLLCLQGGPATAQTVRQPEDHLRVYVVTMDAGDLIWERWGHNAVCVVDERKQSQTAYHWGLFDFSQQGFFTNFIRGRMRYWMEGRSLSGMVAGYENDNRSVRLQELNLTPAQKRKLDEFLKWNARPENKYYYYDYYLDNCSTRVRDAVDLAQRRSRLDQRPRKAGLRGVHSAAP